MLLLAGSEGPDRTSGTLPRVSLDTHYPRSLTGLKIKQGSGHYELLAVQLPILPRPSFLHQWQHKVRTITVS